MKNGTASSGWVISTQKLLTSVLQEGVSKDVGKT